MLQILDGKAAVVSGGGRGVGRGHCLELAKAGAAVVVNDIDQTEADKVVAQIRAAGGRAVADASDIGSEAGAGAAVARCVAEFGGIDIFVANAGFARDRTFLKMSEDDFDAVFRVHVKGTFFCLQAAARQMRDQGRGGSLITTVSAAHFGNFGQTNYAAAKGALASMTYTLALELARYGIRVNGISPLASTRLSQTYRGADGKEVAMPYFDPQLNGPMVVFLSSDAGNYISGQIFGTGGERISLLSQPAYGHTMFRPGGWDYAAIAEHFKNYLGAQLEPIGLMKAPYPFYDGIKPPRAG